MCLGRLELLEQRKDSNLGYVQSCMYVFTSTRAKIITYFSRTFFFFSILPNYFLEIPTLNYLF